MVDNAGAAPGVSRPSGSRVYFGSSTPATKHCFNLCLKIERGRVASPDDPAVATDQEGGRHAGDRVGGVGVGRFVGFVLGTPELLDGPQAVLMDVLSERFAVVVDADRDQGHVLAPRLPTALAERRPAVSIGSLQGPHHVAQNSRKTIRPRKSAILTGWPVSRSKACAGSRQVPAAQGHAKREILSRRLVLDSELSQMLAPNLDPVLTAELARAARRDVFERDLAVGSELPLGDGQEAVIREACTKPDNPRPRAFDPRRG